MKERIITAICMLAVVLPLIYLGGYWFAVLIFIATAIAAWEMMEMHDKDRKIPLWIKGITFIGTLLVAFLPTFRGPTFYDAQFISIVFVLVLLVLNAVRTKKDQEDRDISLYPFIIFYIGYAFRALLHIREHSLMLFIFLITTVVLTDSMAYFAGRFFGKNKLAPKISPKKTVEGAIGGWLSGAAFAIVFGLANNLFTETWILIVLAICLPILSQIGDLVASALKRKYEIKDFSNIFPGHGGVMDRVDSQMLAGILLYMVLYFGG